MNGNLHSSASDVCWHDMLMQLLGNTLTNSYNIENTLVLCL